MARKRKEGIDYETVNLPEGAIDEIARLMKEGYTSGILDEGDDSGIRTSWDCRNGGLTTDSWKDL